MNIVQKAKKVELPDMDVQKVRGITKIELYNPSTKIKKVYRDENIFQSFVLAAYMRGLGEANNNPFANNGFANSKSWINLVGGIFLFRDAITEGTQYMPAGNRMIGNGSYEIVNNNVPVELGSYNSVESSASGSAITQVYDYTTSQGNGTIGCVCLTSATGGYIGYGNPSEGYKTNSQDRFNFSRNQNYLALNRSNSAAGTTGKTTVVGNMVYEIINNSTTVTVRKSKVAVTSANIFNGFYTETVFDKSVVGNHTNWTTHNFWISTDGPYIYWAPGTAGAIQPGDTGYYYKYDTTNDTLTEESLLNSADVTILFGYASYGGGSYITVSHGLLFAVAALGESEHKSAVFDISTGVYKGLIPGPRSNGFGAKPSGRGTDGLVFVHTYESGAEYIYDTVNETCYPTNGNEQIEDESSYVLDYIPSLDAIAYGTTQVYLYKNPLYLATINNLQTEVTKTAAQTMKVTYTLTEEEPE